MNILRPVHPGKSDDISSVGYYSTAKSTGLHSGNELVPLENILFLGMVPDGVIWNALRITGSLGRYFASVI